jgi:hypothetical protein
VTDQAVILRENYFTRHPDTGKKIDWYTNCYFPLAKRWSERVRKVSPDILVFLEPIPNQVGMMYFFLWYALTVLVQFCPESWTEEHRLANMVFAPHWYVPGTYMVPSQD